MTYQPKKGDRIRVTRTPGNHGPVGVMIGPVLNIVTIGGRQHLDFRDELNGGRAYLATNEQMAEMGVKQTIEPAPKRGV